MDKQAEQIIRDTASSLCCDMLTDAPFQMGELQIEKVGFAEIPVAFVIVACPPKAVSAIVPVARQFIYREFAAAGIENEILAFTPTVQEQRRGKFVDCNEHSPSKGKNKMGRLFRFAFEDQAAVHGLFLLGRLLQQGGTDTGSTRPSTTCVRKLNQWQSTKSPGQLRREYTPRLTEKPRSVVMFSMALTSQFTGNCTNTRGSGIAAPALSRSPISRPPGCLPAKKTFKNGKGRNAANWRMGDIRDNS